MKKTILILSLVSFSVSLFAQKKTTTTATISFDATTPKDDLPKADNKTAIGSLDLKTGEVAFEAAVSNFSFGSPKMQEHFNGANWMNSASFPKFTYTGKIDKINLLKLNKNGTYPVKVKGDLTIKGISKSANVDGTITVDGSKISIASSFSVSLADYSISGQPIDAGKVSKEPKISVSAIF